MQDKKDGWRLRLLCLSIGWDLHTPDDPADAPSHWQRYGFDGAGRLNAVRSPAGNYQYTYLPQSHLLASVAGPVHSVVNSYESARDVMTVKNNASSSGIVSRFGAKYDALGRRIEITRSGSAFAQNFVSGYEYDLLGQLTKDERFAGSTPGDPAAKLEEESFSFLYDGIGNRLTAQKGTDTITYTPNALNQYTDIDGIEPVYDADGNLFSDGKNRFHWDAENRLTLVEPLVATEGGKRLEFNYDYIGRRVSKQVWTHTGGSWTDTSTTAFVYDGWNLIEEIATSSQTASINHYTWGLDLSGSLQGAGGVGGLLSVVWTPFTESGLIGDWLLPIGYVSGLAPSTFHYTFDLNGNVSEVLDSTGTIAAHYEYGPFGETLVEYFNPDLRSSISDIRFSTKYYDTELKTLYYGYRYYDPTNGRWLNRDSIEESGGLNLYGFVGNDSVNRWDLWGMKQTILPPPAVQGRINSTSRNVRWENVEIVIPPNHPANNVPGEPSGYLHFPWYGNEDRYNFNHAEPSFAIDTIDGSLAATERRIQTKDNPGFYPPPGSVNPSTGTETQSAELELRLSILQSSEKVSSKEACSICPERPDVGWVYYMSPDYRSRNGPRAQGVSGVITAMTPYGTHASINPVGWYALGRMEGKNNRDRGHLLARQNGGSGKTFRNIVPLQGRPFNQTTMRLVENRMRKDRSDSTVCFVIKPEYSGLNGLRGIPYLINMVWVTSKGKMEIVSLYHSPGIR